MKPAFLSSRYYLKFDLDRDPFPRDSSQARLFLTHELTQLLNELIGAIKTRDKILVVESCPGGGKSALAGFLSYAKEANWLLSLVDAADKPGEAELAHTIISQHFPRHRFDRTKSSTLLQDFLQLYQRNGKLPVILIDNAHLLSRDTLKFVSRVSNLRYEDAQFRLVLFSDSPTARSALATVMKIDADQYELRRVPMFTKNQTAKYLSHRLSLAGQSRLELFSVDVVETIFRKSAGIPGEINRLAKQHMQDYVIPGRGRAIMLRTVTGIAFGIVLALALYAGMPVGGSSQNTDAQLTVALELPDRGLQTGEDSSSKILARSKRKRLVSDHKINNVANVSPHKNPLPANRDVLLADRDRQSEYRARKVAEKEARQELRVQLAAYDGLALRVSDVLQN